MRWLLTGASGQLGSYLLRHLSNTGDEVIAWSGSTGGMRFGVPLQPVDLTEADVVAAAYRVARPDAILHAAAQARVDECYRDPERARRINVDATAHLAELAGRTSARFVYVSTDLVFDGEHAPYRETDAPAPLSIYGRTKADGERLALAVPNAVAARMSLLFGPNLNGRPNFFDRLLLALRTGQPITMFADEWRTPLALTTAAAALVELARSDVTGILHVGGPERLSRLEMGQRLAEQMGVSAAALVAGSRTTVPGEPRPRDVSLDSSKWRRMFPDRPS